MNKTKKMAFGIGIVVAVLVAVATVPAVNAATSYFVPEDSSAELGNYVYVKQYVHLEEGETLVSQQTTIIFNPANADITKISKNCNPAEDDTCFNNVITNFSYTDNGYAWDVTYNPLEWDDEEGEWVTPSGGYFTGPKTVKICRYKVEAVGTPGVSPFNFGFEQNPCGCPICQFSSIYGDGGVLITNVTWYNGTFTHEGAPTYTISGYTTPAADTVNITNTNNGKEWAATRYGNFYNLTLNVGEDVNATEILQIVACEDLPDHESNCNVSTHEPENIPGEDTNVNLTLNHYCLNYYPDYPYYTKEQDNWSGPAVMKACIAHYYAPEDVPSQAELNETGIANNTVCNADLEYVDPWGMKETLNRNWMWPISRNYALYHKPNTTDGLNYMLHKTCYWQHLGPAPVPAYGDYSNWMVVRGIHTSEDPYPQSQGSYGIYGFWINDPNDGSESIGENSYKTVDQWTDNYYLNLSGVRDGDYYQYKYVGLFEPPEEPDREVRLVHARPRFTDAITPMLAEEPMMIYGIEQLAIERVVKDDESLRIVKAAIDGVTEELIPYDSEFAVVFAKTVPGKPKLVTSDNGDYYLVPFNVPVKERPPVKIMPVEIERPKISGLKKLERMKRVADRIDFKPIPIEPIKVEKTLVVVIVDAADGSFKEASWVADPVTYLPVSKIEAMKLALGEVLDELHVVVAREDARDLEVVKQRPTIELVYMDASPYYPVWKITVNGKVFYVSQDGTVSCDAPEEPPVYSSYLAFEADEYNGWGVETLDPTGMVAQMLEYEEACAPIGPVCLPVEIAEEIVDTDPCEAFYITDEPEGVIVPCPS